MILQANAVKIPLRDRSIHCIITSPPYWGLRDYGVSGQLGLEKTPDCGLQGKLRLRKDLTEDQIRCVVQRLWDAGYFDE
jgi:DNA modification methylase